MVKDKEGIGDAKASLQMLIFPNNCRFSPKFQITFDKNDPLLVNTHPEYNPGPRMDTRNPERLPVL